jgi:prevent-host-death family protein
MEGKPMETVGVKELKNKLTYYLKLTKEGNKIIVTDRRIPVAIIQSIDHVKNNVGLEDKLASLAKRGMLRLPLKKGKLPPFKSVKASGKPASEIIIEGRR